MLSYYGSVGADEHGDSASTTSGARVALGVEGNVSGHDNGVAAVPGRRLDPVDGVEEGIGAAVARVHGVDALDTGVVAEKGHEHRLDRLRLVEEGLGADLESANRVGVDVVLLEQVRDNGQREGVDVW